MKLAGNVQGLMASTEIVEVIFFTTIKLFQDYIEKTMEKYLIVSLGAIIGASARYWVGSWAADRFGTSFPYGTMLINLTGSFLLGFFIILFTDRFLMDPRWRLLVAIGILGSYTTFSTYTYESVTLILNGQIWLGIFNLLGSSVLGAVAVVLGVLLGKVI
jgi:CrcB protein